MIRPLTCICMLMAAGSGLYLYQTKHRTRMLDKSIEQTLAATEVVRERTRLLGAEWALLNDPGRLGELAGKFLTLRPVSPGQFTTLAELDRRLPATRSYQPAGTLPPAPPPAPPEIPLAQLAPIPAAPPPEAVLPRPEKSAGRIAVAQAAPPALAQTAPTPTHAATPPAAAAPVVTAPAAPPAHALVAAQPAAPAPAAKPAPHAPAPAPVVAAETRPETAAVVAAVLPAAKPVPHPAAAAAVAERHDTVVEHAAVERRDSVAAALPPTRPGISALAGPMATPVANPVMLSPVVSRVMATTARPQPRADTAYNGASETAARPDRFSTYAPRVASSLGSARSLLAPPVPVSAAETVAIPGAR